MENFRPLNNYLLVKPNLKTDEIDFNSGKLRIDITYEKEKHAPTSGVVMAVPEKLFYHQKEPSVVGKPTPHYSMLSPDPHPNSTSFDVDMEVEVGDEIYFHYLTKSTSESQGLTFFNTKDNSVNYLIPYDQCFVVKRKGEIIPINGYLIAERITVSKDKIGSLVLPDSLRKKDSIKFAKIVHVGSPVRGYRGEHDICELNIDTVPGDIVAYDKNSDIPIQYEYHNQLDGKKRYVRMQRRDLSAIIPKEYFNKIHFE